MLSAWGSDMSVLVLVKHSLPEVVENVPAREWKLSVEGRARGKRLAHRLAEFHPDRIFSSIEPKAGETAGLIAEELGLSVDVFEGLHEHDRSNVGYLSSDRFENAVQEFFTRPNELVFGNETADQAYRRFKSAVDSITKKCPDQTVVLVSHGTVISLYVSRLTGISELPLWKELGLPSFIALDVKSNTLIRKENIQ